MRRSDSRLPNGGFIVGCRMVDHFSPAAGGEGQDERPAPAGRSQGSQRHFLCCEWACRGATYRNATALYEGLQSLQSLGQGGHLATSIRDFGTLAAKSPQSRQLMVPLPFRQRLLPRQSRETSLAGAPRRELNWSCMRIPTRADSCSD